MTEEPPTGTQSVRTGYCEVAEQPGLCGGRIGRWRSGRQLTLVVPGISGPIRSEHAGERVVRDGKTVRGLNGTVAAGGLSLAANSCEGGRLTQSLAPAGRFCLMASAVSGAPRLTV